MTVQVLGTGRTGNSKRSDWLAQFSLVSIGLEGSCDVETAAVKRAVRTLWRPGKGCGRVGRVFFLDRDKEGGWQLLIGRGHDGTESVSSRYR